LGSGTERWRLIDSKQAEGDHNPEIVESYSDTEVGGMLLSIPDVYGDVERPNRVPAPSTSSEKNSNIERATCSAMHSSRDRHLHYSSSTT